jgi:Xaa-Pro aminopeptidase
VRLLERAKALIARMRPQITLGELHLEAMKLLVAALEKRKFAVCERPRQRAGTGDGAEQPQAAPRQRGETAEVTESREPSTEVPRQRWRLPA